MAKYRGDVDDKILELQEAMQRLQMLKQIGAENLILKQEREIYSIQRDIMDMNENTSVDAADAILPKRCRFCVDKVKDEEKIECFEKNHHQCQKKEPMHIGLLSITILKIVIAYISLLLLLFTFLLLTNILFTYIDERWLVFTVSLLCLIGIMIIFYWPMKRLFGMVS